MFLFIFESIGTSELVMIGIVALIFLGPRRMPEIAKKVGKIMAEFRTTTQDFKSTWEREVNFDEEIKAFKTDLIGDETVDESTREKLTSIPENTIGSPEIKQIDKESFDKLAAESNSEPEQAKAEETKDCEIDMLSDKRNWL